MGIPTIVSAKVYFLFDFRGGFLSPPTIALIVINTEVLTNTNSLFSW